MNPVVLTKIAKYTLIGSVSALISLAASFNSDTQMLFACALGGTIFIGGIAVLWEGRESLNQPTEEGLNTLLTTMSGNAKPKRQYLLSPHTRLEIVIGLIVVVVTALIGAM